jgi:hypothetical protein
MIEFDYANQKVKNGFAQVQSAMSADLHASGNNPQEVMEDIGRRAAVINANYVFDIHLVSHVENDWKASAKATTIEPYIPRG